MPLTPEQIVKVKIAEREFYERCYASLAISVAVIIARNGKELSEPGTRGTWIDERAMRSVDRWRARFAPERVGLPLEFEA